MSRRSLVRRLLPVLLLPVLAALLLPVWGEATKGKKYALLVGVNSYEHPKLPALKYAERDVQALAAVLEKAGYEVTLLTGAAKARLRPTRANIEAQLKEMLGKKCRRGDTALAAFAGHGLQFAGKSDAFFCPADARPFAEETATRVSLRSVYTEMDRSFAGVKLLLVDACRNDPASGRSIDVDTAPRPPRGIAALFSCSSGERAFETEKLGGGHGVFFHFVLQGLRGKAKNARGAVTWGGLVEYVTEQVSDEVPRVIRDGARQTPHLMADLKGKSPVLLALVDSGTGRVESRVERPVPLRKKITNTIGMKLVLIPKGTFTMGSPTKEDFREPGYGGCGKEDQHEVELSRPFYMGVYEVTQGEYEKVRGYNPSYFSAAGLGKGKVAGLDTSRFPVERVSWEDAVEFCKKLSARPAERATGWLYRLPTEAEWEYACRAGTSTPFHYGSSLSSRQANFNGLHPYGGGDTGPHLGRTARVGSYEANPWGLYDMHGNVSEWVADWYDKDYYKSSPRTDPKGPATGTARVYRGGSVGAYGHGCRAAERPSLAPGFRHSQVGFRVVCVPAARTP